MNEPTATHNLKIRNWSKFQHFKDRRPPWIKLHRDILEQRDISVISDRSFRVLICLWLIASEDERKNGNLPSVDDIAFRVRMSKSIVENALRELKPFLEQGDITMISGRYQADDPETETEGEGEKEADIRAAFEKCWQAFGRYGAKQKSAAYWRKLSKADREEIAAAIPPYLACVKAGRSKKQFEGWINPENKLWQTDWTGAKAEALKLAGRAPSLPSPDPGTVFNGDEGEVVYE